MTERTLTATVDAADGVPATGTVEIVPTGTRSSDPTLVSAEPIIYKIIAGALVRDTGAVGEAAPTIWSPGNYIIVVYDENRAKLERYEVAVEESALSVSLNELYRQANGATPVVDLQPLYTSDDIRRLAAVGGTNGQVLGVGPGNTIVYTTAGAGDMTKAVYDPTNIAASPYTRANHTGTQPLSTISDAGNAASKNVGTAAGTVASGDHTHSAASGAAAGFMAATDKTKLDGIATGATANATDAELRDRATHTGTQSAGTITGLATVATTGAYADLSGRPTLGTAAALDVGTGAGNVVRFDASTGAYPAGDGALITNTGKRYRVAILAHRAAAGSLSQIINPGAFRTRLVTNLVTAADVPVTLYTSGGNQNLWEVTAGTYRFDARVMYAYVVRHRTRLRSVNPANHTQLDPVHPLEWYGQGATTGDVSMENHVSTEWFTLTQTTLFTVESDVQTSSGAAYDGGYNGTSGSVMGDGVTLVPEEFASIFIHEEY